MFAERTERGSEPPSRAWTLRMARSSQRARCEAPVAPTAELAERHPPDLGRVRIARPVRAVRDPVLGAMDASFAARAGTVESWVRGRFERRAATPPIQR